MAIDLIFAINFSILVCALIEKYRNLANNQDLLIDGKVFDQSAVCEPIKFLQLHFSQLCYLKKQW